jgi:hypothetical protein
LQSTLALCMVMYLAHQLMQLQFFRYGIPRLEVCLIPIVCKGDGCICIVSARALVSITLCPSVSKHWCYGCMSHMSLGCCCYGAGPGVHVHLMLHLAPACANKLLRAACFPYVAGFAQASSIAFLQRVLWFLLILGWLVCHRWLPLRCEYERLQVLAKNIASPHTNLASTIKKRYLTRRLSSTPVSTPMPARAA